MQYIVRLSFVLIFVFVGAVSAAPRMEVAGDWKVRVEDGTLSATFDVAPPKIVQVENEKIDVLPIYNDKGPAYRRGFTLRGVKAQECSVRGAIDLSRVRVTDAAGGKAFVDGTDYRVDDWGSVGRLDGGSIGADRPVFVSYSYAEMRIDSVVLTAEAKLELRQGESHVSIPAPPPIRPWERRIANIWISGAVEKLTDDALFPILADRYPESERKSPSVAERLLPKTMKKLTSGEKVHILAWGDSVTDAGYLPSKDDRWQEQFVRRLRVAFPKAEIVLTTEAWGGRNTSSYFAEPPGSVHNYKEKVLDAKPDLVVMEFVNDSWMSGEKLSAQYGKILSDFNGIGAEWIILTPHYVRPDWMGLKSNRNIDDDPRPYVASVRKFGEEKGIAVADGAARYGHLWRQGIPYITLMMNNINHPDGYGMSLFADALMELFPVASGR